MFASASNAMLIVRVVSLLSALALVKAHSSPVAFANAPTVKNAELVDASMLATAVALTNDRSMTMPTLSLRRHTLHHK